MRRLQRPDELGQLHVERVGDALCGGDGWSVPAALDLAEVLGVHARDAVGDLLKRLVALLASFADPRAELLRHRVSGRATGHRRIGVGGTLHPQSRDANPRAKLDMFPFLVGCEPMTRRRSSRQVPLSCIAVVAVVLCAAAVAGCGGGSTRTTAGTVTRVSSPSTPTAPAAPTKAQFVARADAICARTNAKLKPVQGRLAAVENVVGSKEGAAALRQGATITREGIAQLQALAVPQGDAATVQKIITALDDEAADIDNMAAAAAGGEASAIEAAKRAEQTTKAAYQGLAQGYGLKVCGASS